jgi:ribosomal protein S18 acetylase RimI-like enzyme
MGVHPDFRGQGLGRALLRAEIERFKRLGAARVLVHTDNQRDAAFALYQSAGFRVIEDVWVYRKDWP